MKRALVTALALPLVLTLGACNGGKSDSKDAAPVQDGLSTSESTEDASGTPSGEATTSTGDASASEGSSSGSGSGTGSNGGSSSKSGSGSTSGKSTRKGPPVTAVYGCRKATFTNNTSKTIMVFAGQAHSGDTQDVRLAPGASRTITDTTSDPFGWSAKSPDYRVEYMIGPQNIDLDKYCKSSSKPKSTSTPKATSEPQDDSTPEPNQQYYEDQLEDAEKNGTLPSSTATQREGANN